MAVKKALDDFYELEGISLPGIAFGTYNKYRDADNLAMIKLAIEAGYRYFDTASLYGTERALGQAIEESGIKREEFIIATKLWHDERGYEEAKAALERSLSRLKTDYIDLYLIHWPKSPDEENWAERNIQTWKAMEEMVDAGKVRAIGLSNFLPHHLKPILENCRIRPVLDQLELHAGYTQEVAVNFCRKNGILPQAWSSIGRGNLLDNEIIKSIAQRYGKTVPQLCLRYLVQKEILPVVKTSTLERMKQNADIFDFEISEEDFMLIDCMPQSTGLGEHPDFRIPNKKSNPNQ